MWIRHYTARVFREERDGFGDLRDANVLIYWPHGFGDWVFLSYLLPLLEPSNRYFICRYGDHNTSVMDGSAWVTPLYAGANDGASMKLAPAEAQHLGLRPGASGLRTLAMPAALHAACEEHRIDAVLDAGFWEAMGKTPFPHHTKGRHFLRSVVSAERLRELEAGPLRLPLRTAINFDVPAAVTRWVEARLRSELDLGRKKLCLITRNGYTNCEKNWGHRWREELPEGQRREGQECRDFMRLMLERDAAWTFLAMEDRCFSGDDTVRDRALNCASYAELFGGFDTANVPFGLIGKVLIKVAEVMVGVPAGLFHLAAAYPSIPTVGLWTAFFPSWCDEPRPCLRHLVGREVIETGRHLRPGSFGKREGFEFQICFLETRIIPGAYVVEEVEELGL